MLISIIYPLLIGYPCQQLLEDAIDESKCISAAKYKEGVRILRDAARTQGIDKTMAAHELDVILGPMDGRIPTIAAAAGYPVGTMPLGYSKTNGRPFGMCIVAAAGNEDKILRTMMAWDATIAERKPPPQLQKVDAEVIPSEKEGMLDIRPMDNHLKAHLKYKAQAIKLRYKCLKSKTVCLKPDSLATTWKSLYGSMLCFLS